MKMRRMMGILLAAALLLGVFSSTALADGVDGSKGASPTELTPEARQTEVTLSLPSAEYHDEYDIVFVMDSSSSAKYTDFEGAVRQLFDYLIEHDATINVAVIKFRGRAFDAISLASNNAYSGLVEYSASTRDAIINGINVTEEELNQFSRGSNLHGGLDMANDLLTADTDVEDNHKFVIALTDGKNYIWNNSDGIATSFYSQYYRWQRGVGSAIQYGGLPMVTQATGADIEPEGYRHLAPNTEAVWYNNYSDLYNSTNPELTGISPYEQRCTYAYGEGNGEALGSVVRHASTNGADLFNVADYQSWYEFIPNSAGEGLVFMEANPYELVLDENGQPVLDEEGRVTFDTNTPNPDFYMLHPNCLLKGLYMAGHLWTNMDESYHCAAITYKEKSKGSGLNIAGNFCEWIVGNSEYGADVSNTAAVAAIFDSISDDIIYMVGSGTVTDEIPAEFTLVENGTQTFRMTLNGEALPCTADGTAAWNFGTPASEGGDYPYRVEYDSSKNSFQWIINVPVENSRPVTLSYTLEIDEDAELGAHDTNVSAALAYTTTRGEKGTYTFSVPEVTYSETFTVRYTDGVDGQKVFADQVYTNVERGAATPAFSGTPQRSGYTFVRWTPAVADTVTADAVYTAVWQADETTAPSDETTAPTDETTAPSEETTAPAPTPPTPTPPTPTPPAPAPRPVTPTPAAPPITPVVPNPTDEAEPSDEAQEPAVEPTEEVIEDETVPLAPGDGNSHGKDHWALVNLICAIVSVVTGAGMVGTYFRKKDDEDEENTAAEGSGYAYGADEEEEDKQKRRKSKFLGIIPAAGSVIAFLLTEDMRLPMRLTDKWTILMVVIALIGIILAIATKNRKKEEEDEEQTAA